jgi:hypothetical protein
MALIAGIAQVTRLSGCSARQQGKGCEEAHMRWPRDSWWDSASGTMFLRECFDVIACYLARREQWNALARCRWYPRPAKDEARLSTCYHSHPLTAHNYGMIEAQRAAEQWKWLREDTRVRIGGEHGARSSSCSLSRFSEPASDARVVEHFIQSTSSLPRRKGQGTFSPNHRARKAQAARRTANQIAYRVALTLRSHLHAIRIPRVRARLVLPCLVAFFQPLLSLAHRPCLKAGCARIYRVERDGKRKRIGGVSGCPIFPI